MANNIKVKAITARKAQEISNKTGMALCGEMDGRTFYATDENETEVWLFDSKKERDNFVQKNNT